MASMRLHGELSETRSGDVTLVFIFLECFVSFALVVPMVLRLNPIGLHNSNY